MAQWKTYDCLSAPQGISWAGIQSTVHSKENFVNCPKDNSPLSHATVRGIEVDKCSSCGGMWLDTLELDQLEDTVYAQDQLKGSLIGSAVDSHFPCPRCGASLAQFDYRYYGLILERCPNGDGFWLDADEDKQVLELMRRRADAMQRKASAESDWGKLMNRWRRRG